MKAVFAIASMALAGSAMAQTLTLAGPGAQLFANGGGGGFGGTVGGGGITMSVSGGNLNILFTPGANVNDYAAIYLDTRSGGFTDETGMNDTGDDGRNVISNLSRDGVEMFPIAADFGAAFWNNSNGNQGVLFELTSGNTPNHLNFVYYQNSGYGVTVSLATLGNPTAVDFFVAYSSTSGFLSNESLPASPALNGGGNPGFSSGATNTYTTFNRYLIPTPGAAALLGLGGLAAARRRR